MRVSVRRPTLAGLPGAVLLGALLLAALHTAGPITLSDPPAPAPVVVSLP